MNVFISGGCKNGKSLYAQRRAKEMAAEQGAKLYYIATMIPHDDEDEARIKRHLKEREGWGFETLEQGRDILKLLEKDIDPKGVFLLDSVTALLANEMFRIDGTFDFYAGNRVAEEIRKLALATGNIVFVSDYIYSDSIFFDAYTENYREALAHVDKTLAEICDGVIEVTYGLIRDYKNREVK